MPRAERAPFAPPRAEISAAASLLRFHALGAARLAQRNGLATLALLIVMLAFAPDPAQLLRAIGLALTASSAPRTPAILWMLAAILLARRAFPTLQLGTGGWLGSLPLRPADHRRALALALLAPMLPWIAAHAAFATLTQPLFGESISIPSLVGAGVGYAAAGAAVVPVRRRWLAGPLALLLGWDLAAGPATSLRRPRPRARHADRWIGPTLAWRALGRRWVWPTAVGACLLGAAWLFRANNDVPDSQSAFVVRLALLGSLWLGLLILAEALLARRRPWPWRRSLPDTSTRRCIEDGIVLGVPALPAIVLAALLDRGSAVVGLGALPLLAAIGVWALRLAPGRILGVVGPFSWTAGLVVAACALRPAAALLALPLAPLLIRLAARVDRAQVVTGWEPLHHDAAGDSMNEVSR